MMIEPNRTNWSCMCVKTPKTSLCTNSCNKNLWRICTMLNVAHAPIINRTLPRVLYDHSCHFFTHKHLPHLKQGLGQIDNFTCPTQSRFEQYLEIYPPACFGRKLWMYSLHPTIHGFNCCIHTGTWLLDHLKAPSICNLQLNAALGFLITIWWLTMYVTI